MYCASPEAHTPPTTHQRRECRLGAKWSDPKPGDLHVHLLQEPAARLK
jgi:hypothetical protein